MLHIQIVNKSSLAPVSDYEYRVMINNCEIAGGKVDGHSRKDGWISLVEMILEQEKEKEER
ncbi:MAG: hypothetical protein DRO67_01670 [Candidatus Asgardarchaeum californiense]|nr:MAG: hypothetical protein DRO67_01670 [Candidatus Asgardarchaeum californiense]